MSEGALRETAAPYRTGEPRSEFAPLIDELYREEVLDARRMTPEEKFLAGEELFEYACSITLAGIQSQNPDWNADACRRELDRRLELGERLQRTAR